MSASLPFLATIRLDLKSASGGAYRKGTTRVSLGYGRQRGGLVCVGGVCRFVPESTGISLSFNTAF